MLVENLPRFIPQKNFSVTEERSEERLRHHYLVERELADRLRNAPDAERGRLYPQVYDELMRRVPDHPQLTARSDPEDFARRARECDQHFAFLRPSFTLAGTELSSSTASMLRISAA